MPVLHYVQPDWLFASPDINPDNIGFCVPDEFTCPPSGLVNASVCFFRELFDIVMFSQIYSLPISTSRPEVRGSGGTARGPVVNKGRKGTYGWPEKYGIKNIVLSFS